MGFSAAEVLGELFSDCNDKDILLPETTIETDSRKVSPGAVFVAIPGVRCNGSDFIADAIHKGAGAIVYSGENHCEISGAENILWCRVSSARNAAARLYRHFYGYPDQDLRIYGVTGTNGKTTSAYLLRHILESTGNRCGLVSTVEFFNGRNSVPATHTTPDPKTLYALFQEMQNNGADYAAMEFSSHALAQNRLDNLQIRGAIFTNLTGDHLDFHQNMDNYYAAKKTLFTGMIQTGGVAAINVDDPFGVKLAEELKKLRPDLLLPTFGRSPDAGWRISETGSDESGCRFVLSNAEQAFEVSFPLAGEYNISNLAGAITLLLCDGVAPEAVNEALQKPLTVPGRLEKFVSPAGANFFVDYAHTDDALRNVLETLRKVCRKRLIAVFGAGGDRDRSKRPRMGRVAAEKADHLIITSDNPRSESPEEIIEEICSGIPENFAVTTEKIPLRKKALHRAVEIAGDGDIVLIAGKGHENYQEINGGRYHFDDREILLDCFGAK